MSSASAVRPPTDGTLRTTRSRWARSGWAWMRLSGSVTSRCAELGGGVPMHAGGGPRPVRVVGARPRRGLCLQLRLGGTDPLQPTLLAGCPGRHLVAAASTAMGRVLAMAAASAPGRASAIAGCRPGAERSRPRPPRRPAVHPRPDPSRRRCRRTGPWPGAQAGAVLDRLHGAVIRTLITPACAGARAGVRRATPG